MIFTLCKLSFFVLLAPSHLSFLIHRIPLIGNNPKLLTYRALAGFISLSAFFIALARIPLGSAISIRYMGPIFGAIMAFIYLKEKVSSIQWLSFAIAFTGVMFLKGFDLRIDFLSLFLILTSALFIGMVFVLIRFLAQREHYMIIINYFMVTCIIGSLFFIQFWRMPLGTEWWSVIGIGIFGLIGQIFMTQAFQTEETSVLAPFKYMELVYALIMGYIFFGESYTLLPFIGIVLIMAGMIMNVWAKNKHVKAATIKP